MKLITITPPAVEPVTLDEVKSQLSIEDAIQDDILQRRIKEAREWVEQYTSRSLITQTLEIAANDFHLIEKFYRYPVQSIVSIKYFDSAGVEQTADPLIYDLDTYSNDGELHLKRDESWPDSNGELNNVKVQFVAGYGNHRTDVPGPVREAILLIIDHWTKYQAQNEIGAIISRIPFAVEHLLSQWRIIDEWRT